MRERLEEFCGFLVAIEIAQRVSQVRRVHGPLGGFGLEQALDDGLQTSLRATDLQELSAAGEPRLGATSVGQSPEGLVDRALRLADVAREQTAPGTPTRDVRTQRFVAGALNMPDDQIVQLIGASEIARAHSDAGEVVECAPPQAFVAEPRSRGQLFFGVR